MTKDQIEKLRIGDKVRFEFIIKRKDDGDGIFLVSTKGEEFHMHKSRLEYGDCIRRRFKKGDLVKYQGKIYLVSKDEDNFLDVRIVNSHKDSLIVLAYDLALLMTAKELNELKEV